MQLPADHSVHTIMTAFDNRLYEKNSETHERYVFNKRKQKEGETVVDYIAALRLLASTCNFCDCLKDSLVRDRIVLGIEDGSTRKRLLQEADLNLETCIAMCRAAEAASPSQPVKIETWAEDTSTVQAGSVSPGDQRPGKKQCFSQDFRHHDELASLATDEAEMSKVNVNTEMDDSDDDTALRWTAEHQSSDTPHERTKQHETEPAWPMQKDSPDQFPADYSTAQPMSDHTSESLLSLERGCVCQHCSVAFVLVSRLKLHLASVHGEKLLMGLSGSSTPDRCDADNCSDSDIDNDIDNGETVSNRKVSNDDTANEDGKNRRQHVCDVCGKAFLFQCFLKKHKLTHSGGRSFTCGTCSQVFTSGRDLKTHLTGTGHLRFACDLCDKRFCRADSLTIHKRLHTGERPFKCPHCDGAFNKKKEVQHHIQLVHTRDRPYLCDICGSAFVEAHELTVHRRRHTGVHPYVCSRCGKGFVTSTDLKRHGLTHTGEKSHVCTRCGKAFAHPHGLKEHGLSHSDDRPYRCRICPSAFKMARNLKAHVKQLHQRQSSGQQKSEPESGRPKKRSGRSSQNTKADMSLPKKRGRPRKNDNSPMKRTRKKGRAKGKESISPAFKSNDDAICKAGILIDPSF